MKTREKASTHQGAKGQYIDGARKQSAQRKNQIMNLLTDVNSLGGQAEMEQGMRYEVEGTSSRKYRVRHRRRV